MSTLHPDAPGRFRLSIGYNPRCIRVKLAPPPPGRRRITRRHQRPPSDGYETLILRAGAAERDATGLRRLARKRGIDVRSSHSHPAERPCPRDLLTERHAVDVN